MTHWRSLGDSSSEYIGAWDLPKDVTVEIVDVRAENLPARGDIKASRRPVISFKGAKKKLIVNATNGKSIAGQYGNDVTAWIGKSITLFASTTKSKGGGMVDCVRVRPTIPKTPARPLEGHPVNEEMRARQKASAGEVDESEPQAREPGVD